MFNSDEFSKSAYMVSFAERRDIDEEWNLIEWNRKHREVDCHRLYYRTDSDGGKAVLHLTNADVELVCGRVYFIPAFSVLQSEIDGKMNKYYIHFRSNSYVFGLYRYFSQRYSVPSSPVSEELFKTVIDSYTKNTSDAYMRIQGAMNLLLADFFSDSHFDQHSLVRFEPVLSYIDKNYKRSIYLSELASIMNISTMYFSNSFKQAFRISPRQYILNKRLTESQQLLLETDMSVKEIAYAVGFENENYFSELFSAKIGISPMKFRKRAHLRKRESIL